MEKNKVLLSEVKSFSGSVLGIGDISDEIVKSLNNNKKVTELNILSNKDYNIGSGLGKGKKISIKKLRKFKKKRINYLLIDYENIDEYIKTIVKDSIYITSDYIYFVTNNKKIKKYYSRYSNDIKEININKSSIYVINSKDTKNNIFKEFIYSIIDSVDRMIEIITNLLLS